MTSIAHRENGLAYKWWVTIAVTLAMFMSIMDNTIVNVAIPTMQRAFSANLSAVQWVVTIYMITQAAVIPTAPYLTARFGATRAYLWTLSAFLLGSLLCGFAWNLPSLIIFRLIQGLGGGVLLPMVMILLYQAFPVNERGRATSAMGVPLLFAPAFGPVLGGFLVSYLGWQWAFFINVPLGVVAIVIAVRVLRPAPPVGVGRFDGVGFLTIAAGSASLLYGIATLPQGNNPLEGVIILLIGLGLLAAFALIERRISAPLLDLRRFRDATFTFSTLALILYTAVYFGIIFLVPIYLQNVQGLHAAEAGSIQAALALASLVILPIAGSLSDRVGPRLVAVVGLLAATGAVGLMMTLAVNTPLWNIAAILAVLGVGSGCAGQMQVSAMRRIRNDEQQEVAHGTTLLSVLRATAAPLGVTLLSVLVQARSSVHIAALTATGVQVTLARREGTLLAMHDCFVVGLALLIIALIMLALVPAELKSSSSDDTHLESQSLTHLTVQGSAEDENRAAEPATVGSR